VVFILKTGEPNHDRSEGVEGKIEKVNGLDRLWTPDQPLDILPLPATKGSILSMTMGFVLTPLWV